MRQLFESIEALNASRRLFVDPQRDRRDCDGPSVIVVDDFYPDPHAIRAHALAQAYFQYSPPLAEQVGEQIARDYALRIADPRPAWVSSALIRYRGQDVLRPEPGFRHAPAWLRERFAALLGEAVVADSWDTAGDGWNGCFHLMYEAWSEGRGAIHHHYKPGDIEPRGWSGVVYLSPDAPRDTGTTLWRDKATGLCIASHGAKFDQEGSAFELAFHVENRFNRLVLFRENVLHRAERGFGVSNETARLTQTFFFHSTKG